MRKALIGLLVVAMVGGLAIGLFVVGRDLFFGQADGARAYGGGRGQVVESAVEQRGNAVAEQGRGQNNNAVQGAQAGLGRGRVAEERGTVAEPSVAAVGWQEIRGTVVAYDHEMTVRTEQGEVLVGMGQSAYVEGLKFEASLGDEVIVRGYEEDGEFKAGEVHNLTTGQIVELRDADGRPMWSGQGRGKNRQS